MVASADAGLDAGQAHGPAGQTITGMRSAQPESEGETRGVFITEPHAASHSSFEGSVKDFPKEAAFGLSLIHESKLTTHVQAKSTGCMQVLWREARGLWSVRLQRERVGKDERERGWRLGQESEAAGSGTSRKPLESGLGGGACRMSGQVK